MGFPSTGGPGDDGALHLRDDDRVVVVGGGPSGAFFAIHLLREARRLQRRLEVVIVERRQPVDAASGSPECRGCGRCAGGISPRLNELLDEAGLTLPPDVVQEEIETVWIHGQWKNFPLRVPRGSRMTSVFRGTVPKKEGRRPGGFDGFMLGRAVAEGAQVVTGEVEALDRPSPDRVRALVREPSGEQRVLDAAFVAVATGVNARCGIGGALGGLTASVRALAPDFVPGTVRRALIFELDLGRDYLRQYLDREVHFMEYGSKTMPLEHVALVPKGGILTITLIGKHVDRANLPADGRAIAQEFLRLRAVNRLIPHAVEAPLACTCPPCMTVRPARHPFGDRLALVGDALGSRLYKDGLFSAFVTGQALAKIIVRHGVDRSTLSAHYGHTVRWLTTDNRRGAAVFALIGLTFGSPLLSRVIYQAFASEMKRGRRDERPLGDVLWKVASGAADYREVLREMLGWRVLKSVLVDGALRTLRNLLTELIFGLRWVDHGRYPTVVLREKRGDVRATLARSLDLSFDAPVDVERMHALKVRAPPEAVFAELARFGDPSRDWLRMRFMDIRRVAGEANEPGAVVRYHSPIPSLSFDVRLTRSVPGRALLYEMDEPWARRGRLAFEVMPTRDGNSRLLVYTAFDFPRGETPLARAGWRVFRAFFPVNAHDVVWNHALCCIKRHAERDSRAPSLAADRAAAAPPGPADLLPWEA